MITPPFRFGAVEADVFRSAQPTLKNYRFLSRLKLRTVVSIAPEGPMEDETLFCREQASQLVPIQAELYREEAVTVSSQQVAQVLAILVDKSRLPALVHCPDGRVLCGVVLWCLRRLQCWDDRASAAEFARFSCVLPPPEVEKFVESFGEEVTIPQSVPRWLWGGDRAHWHPTIRVRHQPPLEVFEPDPIPRHLAPRGEVHTRTDYLGMRRGMHAHNKVPDGVIGADGLAGGGGVGVRGQGAASAVGNSGAVSSSARRRPSAHHGQTAPRGLSGQDSFSQSIQDVSIGMLMDEEDEPKLSRAVQALSLEGLEGTPYNNDDDEDDPVYEHHHHHHHHQQQQQQQQQQQRHSSRISVGHNSRVRRGAGGIGRIGGSHS
eukprot:g6513.t1